MSLMTALLNTYNEAEKAGLVDQYEEGSTVLLPIYHNNMRSDGKNIIQCTITKDGEFINAEFLGDKESIIFPVTEKSLTRSGKNPPPHPLVDKLQYISAIDEHKNEKYKEVFYEWMDSSSSESVELFLKAIKVFINSEGMLEGITASLYEGIEYSLQGLTVHYTDGNNKPRKDDLSSVFITFMIEEFEGPVNMSVTRNKALHQDYIQYVEHKNNKNGICYFTGEEDYIAKNHRGLLGNAKLISVSNNKETYYGRFKSGTDIVQIGYSTSEKIHLMLKYLLENSNSNQHLGEQQYLINWFSNDISNDTGVEITKPGGGDIFSLINQKEEISMPATKRNERVGKALKQGNITLSDSDIYYVAIIDKASNGRLSVKYFKELSVSKLFRNLKKWQEMNSWWRYNHELGKAEIQTPNTFNLIYTTYGIERDKKMSLNNGNFRKSQERKLVTHIIDGEKIPSDFVMNARLNVKNRLNYENTWNNLLFVSLAILNNEEKGEFDKMVDKNNKDRSYLYGRLLAVYERIEASTFDKDNRRVTNSEKFWTSYTNNPATMMLRLEEKIKSYEKQLKNSEDKRGLYHKLTSEKQEIINALHDHTDEKELNKSLGYQFIFGYYSEINYIFSKKEENEEEDI